MRPLLVGEDNPYGSDPRYALYPEPRNSAGGRLCRDIMQLSVKDYIRGFERVNLCAGKWSMTEARESARLVKMRPEIPLAYVLLGAKVCAAWGVAYEPFRVSPSGLGCLQVILPHPSGRNRAWNESGAAARARRALEEAGVLPLPPWPPRELPRKAEGEWLDLLPSTDMTARRPAWCSNCHLVVRGEHCPECGPS